MLSQVIILNQKLNTKMKNKLLTFLLIFISFNLASFSFSFPKEELKTKPLKLIFKNLPNSSATIRIGVFRRQDNFPDIGSVYRFYEAKPNGSNEASIEIKDLEYGEYVFGCFQDLNGNGILETSSEGFPAEPVTLSNNFVISSYAPSFEDCKVKYSKKQREFVFEKYTGTM